MPLPVADTTAIVPAIQAEAALPVAAVNLDGGNSTLGDGAAIAVWAWTLLDGPAGHGASLFGAATQTPQLQNIDILGTYVIALVVTNDIGQVSEDDPLLMPDTAYVYVRVRTTTLLLQAPGYYQRNTRDLTNAWMLALEQLKEDFDADRKVFTALDPRIIDVEAAGNHSTAAMAWKTASACIINEITLTLRDGGTIAGGGYRFSLYAMTTVQFLANDFGGATLIGSPVLPAPGADNEPTHITVSGLSASVAAGRVIALRVTTAPAAALDLGQGLTALVSWRRG